MTPIFSRSWLMKTTDVRERLMAPASLRSAWLISRACKPGSESPMSPSMYAAAPPRRWAFATRCSASVVLPLDSGPKISVTRPRGMPPIPMAASRLIAPVGMTSTRTRGESAPIRMMAPFPQVFSICVMARLRAFLRSSESWGTSLSATMSVLDMGWEPRLMRPEYTPKPRLSPPGAERVGQVLQLAVYDRDAVEPVDVGRLPETFHPHPRSLHELAPLRPRHRLERAPEGLAPPGLHFHECHQVALARDHVDLRVPDPKPMRHDVASTRQEVSDGLLLPGNPAPVALVLPVRWIAPQPALHASNLIAWRANRETKSLRGVHVFCRCGIPCPLSRAASAWPCSAAGTWETRSHGSWAACRAWSG